jgi:hypothetical protein
MFRRPGLVYTIAVPTVIALWFVSGVGGDRTPSSGGIRYWIGAVGWAAFGIVVLATVLFSLTLGIHTVVKHRHSATV